MPDEHYDQERAVQLFEEGKCNDVWPLVARGLEVESELAAIDLITLVLLSDFTPPGGFSSEAYAKNFILALVAYSIRYTEGNSENEIQLLMNALESASDRQTLEGAISAGCFEEVPQEECKSVLDPRKAKEILHRSLRKFASAQGAGLFAICL